MKTLYWIFLAIVGLSCSAPRAWADFQDGDITLTPLVGYYMTNSYQDQSGSVLTGLGLDVHVTRPVSIEGFVGKTFGGKDDLSQARLDGLYHFNVKESKPVQQFIPYAAGGIGFNLVTLETRDANDMLFNLGGGIKYLMNNNWLLLRVDVRAIYVDSTLGALTSVGISIPFGPNQLTPKPLDYVENPSPKKEK